MKKHVKNAQITTFLLLFAMLFAPIALYAANGLFGVGGGNGLSISSPLIIEDAEDLNEVRNGLAKHYILGNDIDLTDYLSGSSSSTYPSGGPGYTAWTTDGWMPIGDLSNAFTGSLNGADKKIIGLWINRSTIAGVGLFGYATDAIITNLGVEIASVVEGGNYTGGLVGYNTASLRDCNITNCYVTGIVKGNGNGIGGLVGRQFAYNTLGNTNTIKNCYTNSTVSGNVYVGLLVGLQVSYAGSQCVIENCFSTGSASASGDAGAGGIVGSQQSHNSDNSIINCYSTGNVNGRSRAGGVVGHQSADGGNNFVTNCYTTGITTASLNSAGGIVGDQEANNSGNNIITKCYVTGHVNCPSLVGGLVGIQNVTVGSNSISNSYRYQFAELNGLHIPNTDPDHGHNARHGDVTTTSTQFLKETTFSSNGWTFGASGPWYWDNNEIFPKLNFGNEVYPFPFYAIIYDTDYGTLPAGALESYDPMNNPSLLPYTLPTPTKAQHLFDGWFDSSNTLVSVISTGDTGHKKLLAKWTRYIYDVTVDPLADGSVTSDKASAQAGETITLNVVPDVDFELDKLTVYETGNPSNIIATWTAVSSAPYSFTMPAYDVNVVAYFEYIHKKAVEQAIALIEQYIFNYSQLNCGVIDDVIDQLVIDINNLIASTGIKITKSDIFIRNFIQPIAGDSKTPAGKNGMFEFSVRITKGTYSRATGPMTGIHSAIVYYASLFTIYMNPSVNGIVRVNKTTAQAYDIITLTISHSAEYEIDSLWVVRSNTYYTANPLELSATGNVRTFIMPNYDVTVSATFKLKRDVNNEAITQASALKAWVENESLHVSGLIIGQPWSVYSISGILIYQGIATNYEEEIVLPLRGIYIIRSGHSSIKIM